MAIAVWILDVIFSLVSVPETVYLVWKKFIKKYIPSDIEFCRVYLLQKRKTVKIRALILSESAFNNLLEITITA